MTVRGVALVSWQGGGLSVDLVLQTGKKLAYLNRLHRITKGFNKDGIRGSYLPASLKDISSEFKK